MFYVHKGVVRKYRPDFIIRLKSGDTLVLETKGQERDEDRTKRRFLKEWIQAVNAHGGFGRWTCGRVKGTKRCLGYPHSALTRKTVITPAFVRIEPTQKYARNEEKTTLG